MSSPIRSVVFKTPAQSPIQKALTATQKPKPKAAPAPVPPGYGASGPGAPWDSPVYRESGSVLRHAPVKTNQGFVARPTGALARLVQGLKPAKNIDPGFNAKPAPKPKPGAIAVHVHPTHGVTVVHTPSASPSSGSSSPAPVPRIPSNTPTAPVKPVRKVAAKPTTTNVPTAAVPASDESTATSAINAILAPFVQRIKDAATARGTEGTQAIGGYTTNALNQLKGLDFSTPYAGAESGENAINTALLARLTGQGSALQGQLGSELAGINDPNAAARTGTVGSVADAAANTGLAKGDATLSQLISDAAGAKTYGAKLPGITSLAGAQDVAKNQGQITSDENTQLSDLESKVPGMVQSELATLSSAKTAAEKNRIAIALAENIDPYTGQLTEKGRAELKRIAIEQQNANTSAANAQTNATRAANAETNAQRNADLRAASIGIQEKKLKLAIQKAADDKQQKGKLHGLTQAEYQRYQSQALGLARIAHTPTADGHPPVSWQQFLNGGLQQKVPIWVLIEQGKRVYTQPEIKQGLIPGSK